MRTRSASMSAPNMNESAQAAYSRKFQVSIELSLALRLEALVDDFAIFPVGKLHDHDEVPDDEDRHDDERRPAEAVVEPRGDDVVGGCGIGDPKPCPLLHLSRVLAQCFPGGICYRVGHLGGSGKTQIERNV